MGRKVEFASNGGNCPGYLAVPETGKGPGVVVIQEWWGLIPQIERTCDRLAGQGFTALAVDLYHGESVGLQEPDEAGKRLMSLNLGAAARDLSGAVSYLLKSGSVAGDGVGVVGFCMGGGLALYLAALRPEVRAAVAFYGVAPWQDYHLDFGAIRAAVQGHWGENDHSNPRQKVESQEEQLKAAGVATDFHWYPDADHAFFNEDRPEVHNAQAAELAWRRTTDFLRSHLG